MIILLARLCPLSFYVCNVIFVYFLFSQSFGVYSMRQSYLENLAFQASNSQMALLARAPRLSQYLTPPLPFIKAFSVNRQIVIVDAHARNDFRLLL